MSWKTTTYITREDAKKVILDIFNNIDILSDDTLGDIMEIISDDENTELYGGTRYSIVDEYDDDNGNFNI